MPGMKLNPDRDILDLQRYDILRLRDAAGVAVECRRGLLWVTQEGDNRDVIVSAGQNVRLSQDGVTLVEALESATLTLEGCSAELGIRQPPSLSSDLIAST